MRSVGGGAEAAVEMGGGRAGGNTEGGGREGGGGRAKERGGDGERRALKSSSSPSGYTNSLTSAGARYSHYAQRHGNINRTHQSNS